MSIQSDSNKSSAGPLPTPELSNQLQHPSRRHPVQPRCRQQVFGDIPEMMGYVMRTKRVFDWLTSLTARHQSPIIQAFIAPMALPWVVVTDPFESQDILLRRTKEFDRSGFFGDLIGGILPEQHIQFVSTDSRYKNNRHLINHLMAPSFITEVSGPQLYKAASTLIKLWEIKCDTAEGHLFHAHHDITYMALDSIFAGFFGHPEAESITTSRVRTVSQWEAKREKKLLASLDEPVEFPEPELPAIFAAAITLANSVTTPNFFPCPRSLLGDAAVTQFDTISALLSEPTMQPVSGDLGNSVFNVMEDSLFLLPSLHAFTKAEAANHRPTTEVSRTSRLESLPAELTSQILTSLASLDDPKADASPVLSQNHRADRNPPMLDCVFRTTLGGNVVVDAFLTQRISSRISILGPGNWDPNCRRHEHWQPTTRRPLRRTVPRLTPHKREAALMESPDPGTQTSKHEVITNPPFPIRGKPTHPGGRSAAQQPRLQGPRIPAPNHDNPHHMQSSPPTNQLQPPPQKQPPRHLTEPLTQQVELGAGEGGGVDCGTGCGG
ncbi:hypothetical protein CHGG_03511 [Chaetomium globosum CBS 148.51]|uniref:Uncharacterized protein n=1 Tax=Chaetomium globosum (strain ATCC 6205 / CBS 148.51 / DSM 1962 / NBRC 6347 / NRRL 1970) TaxID=306901 RepID=Q2H8E3_CHAGB|nr:uncharacterized protein CHGG_03511 [Chaetomium globosum CBS 148.51]EAQ91576.1 hypothetical protein CHGG_03511 [Chaetomium globosum CBS 148.51]